MPIVVRCPGCGEKYRVSESAAGKSLRCKNAACGERINIPEVVADQDDFASNLDEAAADRGQPLPAPMRALRRTPTRVQDEASDADGEVATSVPAIVSLVLGLFSIVCSILTGLPALVLGIVALININHSRGRLRGTWMAVTGICCGCLSPVPLLMIALLVPAVQAAREAARRTQSRNNLKVIGMALYNYHDSHTGFPPGAIVDKQGRECHGWQTMLLPYVEAATVYNLVDFNLPWNDTKNLPPMQTQIACYLSPGINETNDAAGYALSHYAGNSHLFLKNRAFRIAEITDGSSHTILAGEAAGNFQPWGHPENCRDPGNGIQTGPDSFGRPTFPVAGFLMCDGSVRFLSRDVDPGVLKALATPAGNEVVTIPGDDPVGAASSGASRPPMSQLMRSVVPPESPNKAGRRTSRRSP